MTLREICETLELSRRALQGYEKVGLVTATGRNKYGNYGKIGQKWMI